LSARYGGIVVRAFVYQCPDQRSWDSVPDTGLVDTMEAHDVFADSAKTDALNVVLTGNTAADEQRDEATAAASGPPPRHLRRV
jgi:hypothetical protein